MFSHENIWSALDRLAAGYGMSPSGLAKQAGLDPTAFNRSKRTSPEGKPRWPSTESLSKVLAVTGATMGDFIALMGDKAENEKPSSRTIPIIGYAQAGREGFFDDAGYPSGSGWDEVDFPGLDAAREDLRIYALEISGDSMQPLYREGDIIVVSPDGHIRRGDRIVLKTTSGEVMAKELLRQTASRIDLRSLNAGHDDITLSLDKVSWMARILWVSQ